jgi:hypothetical protein
MDIDLFVLTVFFVSISKKQKRKVRRVLLGILVIVFLPLTPIMWCVRRWFVHQKARLQREKDRLHQAKARAYQELLVVDKDEWLSEEEERQELISEEPEPQASTWSEQEQEQDDAIQLEQYRTSPSEQEFSTSPSASSSCTQ